MGLADPQAVRDAATASARRGTTRRRRRRCARRRDGLRPARADRRRLARSTVRADGDDRRGRDIRRGDRRRGVPAGAARRRRCSGDDRRLALADLAGTLPRRGGGRPPGPGRRPRRPRPVDHGANRRGERRRQSADHHGRGPAGGRRRARRVAFGAGGRQSANPAPDHARPPSSSPLCSSRGCGRRRSLYAPRQVRVRVTPQPVGIGVPGRCVRHEPPWRLRPRRADRCRRRRTSRWSGGPGVRVHPARRQRRAARRRAPRRESRRHSSRRPATAKPGRMAGEPRRQLVALADELGILLAGPNGQGVVSTPASLCAQIVAPYPPPGRIAVASQSGNFVSSFLNLARWTGVGISRAVSAGNAAAVSVADYLSYYAEDPATAVSLAYVEGISDGRALFDAARRGGSTKAARAPQGRCHRRRSEGRGQPHRGVGGRRQSVRRRVPGRRDHPGGDGRGGVRGGGDVRHPTVAHAARVSWW